MKKPERSVKKRKATLKRKAKRSLKAKERTKNKHLRLSMRKSIKAATDRKLNHYLNSLLSGMNEQMSKV